ncbi:helix-turn-helix domain-containing protein [Pseudoflavonifractor phocaeensis]|uniref:helix-turn-helix domain-containing protein n=1 Tax=Pseudoflavonifractor phocaeensis TaxID=1870988 RepID=UPI00210DD846|nr:helix-turn-helix transcriptional regulator [Pseudoflavonifractor phocaeensis]MCQ4863293.1 helix-turn-helix transcriptional regulator [Pseudoflavonifractor phocaeensis]
MDTLPRTCNQYNQFFEIQQKAYLQKKRPPFITPQEYNMYVYSLDKNSEENIYNAFKSAFIKKVKLRLAALKITQQQLAGQTGYSPANISKLLNNKYSKISENVLRQIPTALQCTPWYLLDVVDEVTAVPQTELNLETNSSTEMQLNSPAFFDPKGIKEIKQKLIESAIIDPELYNLFYDCVTNFTDSQRNIIKCHLTAMISCIRCSSLCRKQDN